MKLKSGYRKTMPRDGNDLLDCGDYYIKSSISEQKILSEIEFYQQLPQSMNAYFPSFLGVSNKGRWTTGYKIKKIKDYDASVYFVYAEDDSEKSDYFKRLIHLLEKFFIDIPKKAAIAKNIALIDFIKIRDLERIPRISNLSNVTALNEIISLHNFSHFFEFAQAIQLQMQKLSNHSDAEDLFFGHGDLCLSNIILEDGKLFLIDPRGNKDKDHFMSPYYDFAKLSQCFFGGYDFINHAETLEGFKPAYKSEFTNLAQQFNLNLKLIRCVEASHFLTMLPLHAEAPKKCLLFLKQALRAFESSHD